MIQGTKFFSGLLTKVVILTLLSSSLAAKAIPVPTIIVTTEADAGVGSLRQAVLDASEGDRIRFASNVTTIVLTTGEIVLDKSLLIDGQQRVTVDGNRNGRMFTLNQPARVTLKGLTLQNGFDDTGGPDGGAILSSGILSVLNCTFKDNSADDGGAIFSTNSLTVDQSTFENNSGHSGGAISATGTLDITGSTFIGNHGTDGGGAITCRAIATVKNCVFTQNTNDETGGGIRNLADLTVINSLFTSNTASRGGAIFNVSTATFVEKNNTYINNSEPQVVLPA